MTRQEKINEINTKYEKNYQLTKSNRIFSIFMGKKQYYKFDELVERWRIFELEKNSRNNVKVVCEFIENNGGKLITKSMTNSHYYMFKGYKVRISDHNWTSERHFDPDYNLCSYEKNGFLQMIETLNNI